MCSAVSSLFATISGSQQTSTRASARPERRGAFHKGGGGGRAGWGRGGVNVCFSFFLFWSNLTYDWFLKLQYDWFLKRARIIALP
jgi:hypothetical protein